MLNIQHLTKTYGEKRAVDDLSLHIAPGEIYGFIGHNGAGKTTLMRLMTGFYEPDCGAVELNGYDVNRKRLEALSRVAYVPESGALYPEMTVYEYLRFMAGLRRISHQDFVDNLVSLSKQLELDEVINRKCETLSKGYKRRVGIAGALLHRPKILILDEPTEGLDPNQKFSIRSFIKQYGERNIVIISTHIMEEVEAMANRVILLHRGKLIRDTTPQELKKITPDNDIEAAFRAITFEERE
mgnify:CR=1 FL=1